MTQKFVSRILITTGLVLICAQGATWAADTPDALLTMKTKISLMTKEDLRTSSLNVDTVNGVVTLHGKVPTEAEKVRAGDLARRIDG